MQWLSVLSIATLLLQVQPGYQSRWKPDRRSWPVTIDECPFMVAIVIVTNNKVQWKCGGAIIHHIYALTTASCTHDIPLDILRSGYVRVRSNTSVLEPGLEPYVDHTIDIIRTPDAYVGSLNAYDNDIAIVQIDGRFNGINEVPVKINEDILPNLYYQPEWAIVYSWHKLVLHATNVTLAEFHKCRRMYQFVGKYVTRRMVCGYVNDGENFCNEMDGSPLIWDSALLGLASYAHECSTYNFPATFSRVDLLVKWEGPNTIEFH